MDKEVKMLGELISCPRFANADNGGVVIPLSECKECEHHRGVDIVRMARAEVKNDEGGITSNAQLQINDVLCGLPTRMRTMRHFEGVN